MRPAILHAVSDTKTLLRAAENQVNFLSGSFSVEQVVETYMELMAKRIRMEARRRVPVDTGELKRSIVTVKGEGPEGQLQSAVA